MGKNRGLQPGDLVWVDRGLYNHCGIYEGGGYVIHFAAPQGSEISSENALIHRTTFEHFADGCQVEVVDIEGSKSREETLRRARSCMGMRNYNLATFNCDHFATWCKTGEFRSLQADDVKTVLEDIGSIGKEIGGPIGETIGSVADVISETHELEETRKAIRLNMDYQKRVEDIGEMIKANKNMDPVIPPVPVPAKSGEFDTEEPPVIMDEPPQKKAWYEKVGDFFKGLTYPIAGALEVVKRVTKLPFLQKVNFNQLGAKVRNVIDDTVINVKVFTGRMTPEQAHEERLNNETALAGAIIQQEQKQPIKDTLKQTFGKVGSVVKHVVQQTVTRVVPNPVINAIKTGAQAIGKVIVSGIKTAWQAVTGAVGGLFRGIKRLILG